MSFCFGSFVYRGAFRSPWKHYSIIFVSTATCPKRTTQSRLEHSLHAICDLQDCLFLKCISELIRSTLVESKTVTNGYSKAGACATVQPG